MAHRLDLDKTEVKTTYCIENDLREDQMQVAVSRIPGRLSHADSTSDEPIAIVCYGPSLNKTWNELKNFKKIITCSGAHQFLIEKGIVPNYHVDLDPREHKVRMLGTPHKDVEYIMASCCHPKMWDVLDGFNVKLWHIYNNEDNRDVPLVYPRGEWIFTGGNNVGLRCMVIGRALGFTNQHIFGMDCSFPPEGSHHAGVHLNPSKKIYELPYKGKMFFVEAAMLTYAKQFFHEIKQLPDVKVTLYGDGLLQHMANDKKGEVRTKHHAAIAFSTPVTISKEHTESMRKLHLDPLYGTKGKQYAEVVNKLAQSLKTTSIMDYGCGKGTLSSKLPFPIWEYDPAIAGKEKVPRPSDLVVCFNVLEWVEPEYLDNVLGDLVRCSKKCVFTVIDLEGPLKKTAFEWKQKLNGFFEIGTLIPHGKALHCVLAPRKMGPVK